MARARKQKFVAAAIPGTFNPNFIDNMSERYAMTSVIRERRDALQAHCGGSPSYVQSSIIKRVIWLELIVESLEQKFASGESVDAGAISQLGNTLKGYYKDFGIKPVPQRTQSLSEYLSAGSAA